MASKIKIYKDGPSAGGTDGTLVVAGDPVHSGVIKVATSGYQEGDWIKLAVRCESGYETIEENGKHVTLDIDNTNHVDKWQLAPDDGAGNPDEANAEDWSITKEITDQVTDVNYIFHVRARVHENEEPVNDTSVVINASAVIAEQ